MLDGRKLKMIELKLENPNLSNPELADMIGVTRQAIWEWWKNAEVQAEVDKRLREINHAANQHLKSRASTLMNELLDLALSPNTEPRTKNNALQYLIDRALGKAADQVDLTLNDSPGDAADVLREFKAFLEKDRQLKEGGNDG